MLFLNKLLEKRLEEQVGMILNTTINTTGNFNNIIDLYTVSRKVIIQMLAEKNDITKQEIALIDKSLTNSIALAKLEISSMSTSKKRKFIDKVLDSLSSNNNSFLVQPISYTITHHKVSALIRRKADRSFTFMINDKSQKCRKNSDKMYIEYSHEDKENLLDIMMKPRIRCLEYLNLKIVRDGNLRLRPMNTLQPPVKYNIPTTPQIIGNCYLKEIEFGIKNAIMTRKHSFREIEREGEGIKNEFKLDNEEFQTRYVKELLEKYKNKISSDFVVKINKQLENYHENKVFIKNMKNFIKENVEKDSFSFNSEVKKQLPEILKKSFNTANFKDAFEKQNYSSIYKTIETGMLFIDGYGEKKGIDRTTMYKLAVSELCKKYSIKSGVKIGVFKKLLDLNGKPAIIGPLSKTSINSYIEDRQI